jgi:hypothetical protein
MEDVVILNNIIIRVEMKWDVVHVVKIHVKAAEIVHYQIVDIMEYIQLVILQQLHQCH